MKAITPAEAEKLAGGIPSEVIEVFNEFLARQGGRATTVMQNEVVAEIVKRFPQFTSKQLFERHWLDIEATYRAAGWCVTYDKPAYNENYYEPHWQFSPKRETP